PTLNAEFEIITSAIYAAADQPRPVPVTDDKPITRTHFVYRIDIWTKDGKNIVEHLAGLETSLLRGRRIGLRASVGQTQGSPCVKAAGSWRIAAAERVCVKGSDENLWRQRIYAAQTASAALRNHLVAVAWSCATPWPLAYIKPRLH